MTDPVDRLFSGSPEIGETHALVAVQGGVVALGRYAEGVDVGTTLHSWSMAKSMLHAAVGLLVAEGLRSAPPAAVAPSVALPLSHDTTGAEMGDAPRLAPTTEEDWDDDTRAMLEGAGHLNVFTTLAHHPKLLKRWLVFGGHVLAKSTLPDRERELIILRTGWRCGSDYEFGQHTIIGRAVGLTDDEISRLTDEGTDGWSTSDAMLVTAVDELVSDHTLSDDTWMGLTRDWTTEQVIDLVFAVGQYTLVSTALNSFGVQREEGVPGWPE